MRFPAYPKYKPSGVEWLGDVPEHWDVKRGRFCMDVNPSSRRMRTLRPEDQVSFVPMEAVGEYGGLLLDETRAIADVGAGYTEFDDGDVVVAKITPCFENGKGALAAGLANGAAFGTTELHVLRSAPILARRFLFYFTISRLFRSTGEGEMYGAGGQKRVPPEFCENVRVPLPPMDDQRAIADFLDRETAKIDTLVAKKRTLIERLKEKRTALISRTVTRGLPPDAARAAGLDPHPKVKPSGIDWLGDVPEHWGVERLGWHIDLLTGFPFQSERFSFVDGISLVRGDNVTENSLRWEEKSRYWPEAIDGLERYLLSEGDLLIGMDGSKVGKNYALVAAADLPLLLVQRVARLRVAMSLDRGFLHKLIGSELFRTWVELNKTDPAIPHISPHDIRSYPIPLPSPLEQRVIASFLDTELSKIDDMVASVDTAIERLQEYRTALITAAVTGKIDVRGAHE